MPFPSPGTIPISGKDIVSFTFDDPKYDQDRPLLIDPTNPSRHFTHRTGKETVQRLIAGFHAAGLKPQDTVCIHSFNSIMYPILILAIIGAGGVAMGTNPSYTQGEIDHAIKLAKVRFVLAEPELLENMILGLKNNNVDLGDRLFVLDFQEDQTVPDGLRSYRCLLEHGTKDWIRFDDLNRSTNTTAQLYLSSGTTGLPKCAMTSHLNLVAQHQVVFESRPTENYHQRAVAAMPCFHVGVAPYLIASIFKDGKEIYVMRRFDLIPYLQHNAKYKCTHIVSVPPIIVAIVMSGLADPTSKTYRPECSLKSILGGTVGAAPLSGDIQGRFYKLLSPNATFGQVWGMTETTSIATNTPFDVSHKCNSGEWEVWGTVGYPLPCVECKLIDETGMDVTDTGKGELCIKGPTVIRGYFENPKATAESWDGDGYFKTGDVVEVDKRGLFYVTERMKELIKVRGFQVAPAELEGVLTSHADILDAAVIGIKNGEDEAPRAYIMKRPGSSLTAEDIHEYTKNRLARYKQITGGIAFVESIPKLPSGKILKRVIREQWKKESAQGRAKI